MTMQISPRMPVSLLTTAAHLVRLLAIGCSLFPRSTVFCLAENQDSTPNLSVPSQLISPFGSYPNPFGLTEEDRQQFAPVVKFPIKEDGTPNYRILDHTKPWKDQPTQLVSPEEHERAKSLSCRSTDGDEAGAVADGAPEDVRDALGQRSFDWYGVGRYDENRVGMYESELFAVEDKEDQRTIHIGIDLDGPVGTPVAAFYHGIVHSVGYNPALGDYGNVIVLEHELPQNKGTVYALYGHLDSGVVKNFLVGQSVTKGQILAGMGAYWENGGWTIPHVHFQLSVKPPSIPHDMPGAVAPKDRAVALWDYPDPRYVLGDLY